MAFRIEIEDSGFDWQTAKPRLVRYCSKCSREEQKAVWLLGSGACQPVRLYPFWKHSTLNYLVFKSPDWYCRYRTDFFNMPNWTDFLRPTIHDRELNCSVKRKMQDICFKTYRMRPNQMCQFPKGICTAASNCHHHPVCCVRMPQFFEDIYEGKGNCRIKLSRKNKSRTQGEAAVAHFLQVKPWCQVSHRQVMAKRCRFLALE